MYQYDDPTCASTLPTPAAAGTAGFFTDGSPGGGVAATELRADFMNMLMMELLNVVEAAGETPIKTAYNQMLLALQKMFAPVIGSARNLTMNVTAASATATLAADEIVVGTALGGQKYILPSINSTVNLAATGAGGMDTGAAPVSGFVALYAIWNPATNTAALLATNATAAAAPNVYGGANMPAGYTASALVSVWPTNSSRQFVIGYQSGRVISIQASNFATWTTVITNSPLTIAAIPKNAISFSGTFQCANSSASNMNISLSSTAAAVGVMSITSAVGAGAIIAVPIPPLRLTTAQTVYASTTNSAGAPTFNAFVSSYEF